MDIPSLQSDLIKRGECKIEMRQNVVVVIVVVIANQR